MNTSSYDPKIKDFEYDNSTTFSNAKFANLMNNASIGLSGRFECTESFTNTKNINAVYIYGGYWDDSNLSDISLELPEEATEIPVTASSQFELKGSVFENIASQYSSSGDIIIQINADNQNFISGFSANEWADYFNGTKPINTVHTGFIDENYKLSYYGVRLDKREELTSNDPDGPDITLTFSIVKFSFGKLILTSTSSTGKETVTEIPLSCIGDTIYELTEAVADLQDKVEELMAQ